MLIRFYDACPEDVMLKITEQKSAFFHNFPKAWHTECLSYLSVTEIAKLARTSKSFASAAAETKAFRSIVKGREILDAAAKHSKQFPSSIKNVLNSKFGLMALGEGLIHPAQAVACESSDLAAILCENGLKILRGKYCVFAELIQIVRDGSIVRNDMLSDFVLTLLDKRYARIDELKLMGVCKLSKMIGRSQFVLECLDKKWLTICSIRLLSINDLNKILTPDSIKSMREASAAQELESSAMVVEDSNDATNQGFGFTR